MSNKNGRASLADMDMELPAKDTLPSSPVVPIGPATEFHEEEVATLEQAHTEPRTGAYVPEIRKKEPLVNLGMRVPLRLRNLLEEIAEEYKTDMTKIVVDLLEINLPKIPRKKKAGRPN